MSTQTAQWRVPEWTFADRLRKIRTDSGMHQREFATALGVNAATYAAWESGRNHPQSGQMVAVAKRIEMLTGVPAVWTLGLGDEGSPGRTRTYKPADYRPGEWDAMEDVAWHDEDGWGRAA